jgi:hypothetical protein
MKTRRDFLKLAGAAGLAVMGPLSFTKRARAANEPWLGTFFVTVHAGGGWDPTSLCDPKGRANEETDDPMNMYFTGDIGEIGNLSYAPVGNNQWFFERHYQNLLVLNGVDTQTNSHDAGTRNTWCGQLTEGHPAFSAVVAAALGPDRPMAFVTNGGYDVTQGEVAATRIGNTGVFQRIAEPHRVDPLYNEREYHLPSTQARIKKFQAERLATMADRQHLPHVRKSINSLQLARRSDNELQRLTEALPESLDDSNNPLRRQAQLAMAAAKAGLAISANLAVGGFDTHGNHDANHIPRLERLLDGVDFLWQEAERQGIADRLVVMVGSDFGRTPGYNDTNGKDHWSITSVMLMGQGIKGNRVIGQTDERHGPMTVNPQSLAMDDAGIRIQPNHIHRALRKLAKIEDSDVAQRYFVPGEDLPLLG